MVVQILNYHNCVLTLLDTTYVYDNAEFDVRYRYNGIKDLVSLQLNLLPSLKALFLQGILFLVY